MVSFRHIYFKILEGIESKKFNVTLMLCEDIPKVLEKILLSWYWNTLNYIYRLNMELVVLCFSNICFPKKKNISYFIIHLRKMYSSDHTLDYIQFIGEFYSTQWILLSYNSNFSQLTTPFHYQNLWLILKIILNELGSNMMIKSTSSVLNPTSIK